jgi:hypothetical protein
MFYVYSTYLIGLINPAPISNSIFFPYEQTMFGVILHRGSVLGLKLDLIGRCYSIKLLFKLDSLS